MMKKSMIKKKNQEAMVWYASCGFYGVDRLLNGPTL